MDQLLLLLADWWWIGPAAVGAGIVSYTALTSSRRRARRLEVDAARHEERAARAALLVARAQTRSAQAEVLTARAHTSPETAGAPNVADARRALQSAKDAQRSAALQVRAAHVRTKVALQRYYASRKSDPLPQQRLMAADDALTTRWMDYETDAAKALAFPQMIDGRHPATLAFLRAHREARRLRPASAQTRVTPAEFAEYAAAVRAAEVAFDAAERDAIATARGELPRPSARPTAGSTATMLSDAASALGEAASAFTEAATDRLRTIRWREVLSAGSGAAGSARGPAAAPETPPAAADARPESPQPRVWPVPSRTPRQSDPS